MGKRPLPALSPRAIVAVRDRRPFPSSFPKATQAGAPAVPPWNRVPRSSAPWSVVRRQWHQPPPQRDRYSRSLPYGWIPSRPGRRHPGEDSTLCRPDGRTALRQWHRPPRQRHRRSRSSPGVWIPGVRITSRPGCRHRHPGKDSRRAGCHGRCGETTMRTALMRRPPRVEQLVHAAVTRRVDAAVDEDGADAGRVARCRDEDGVC